MHFCSILQFRLTIFTLLLKMTPDLYYAYFCIKHRYIKKIEQCFTEFSLS